MENLEQILAVLKEKIKLLEDFENATMQMLMCSSEDLEGFVSKRSSIIERVDEADEKIRACLEGAENGEEIIKILNDKFEGEIPLWADDLYTCVKSVKAILARVRESDMQAAARLSLEREKILEQIKQTNGKNSVKAAKFYASSGEKTEKNLSFGNA